MFLLSRIAILCATVFLFVLAQDKVIDCYGINGAAYANNTRCPGSNACCGVGDKCLSNRLCQRAIDGPGTFVRGPCAIDPYDSGTCAQICLYSKPFHNHFCRMLEQSDGFLHLGKIKNWADKKKMRLAFYLA